MKKSSFYKLFGAFLAAFVITGAAQVISVYTVCNGEIKSNIPATFNDSLIAEKGSFSSDYFILKYPERWTSSVYIFKHYRLVYKYYIIDEANNHYIALRFSKLERKLEEYEQHLKNN